MPLGSVHTSTRRAESQQRVRQAHRQVQLVSLRSTIPSHRDLLELLSHLGQHLQFPNTRNPLAELQVLVLVLLQQLELRTPWYRALPHPPRGLLVTSLNIIMGVMLPLVVELLVLLGLAPTSTSRAERQPVGLADTLISTKASRTPRKAHLEPLPPVNGMEISQ